MKSLRNKVQLIGNVGNALEIRNLESGKTLARFSMATNEFYRNEPKAVNTTSLRQK